VGCKAKFAVRLVAFFHDCGEVTAAIELYVYRAIVMCYGIWHLIQKLK